jgi:hypothetical protein
MNKINGSAKMKVSAKIPPLLIHETVVGIRRKILPIKKKIVTL